MGSGSTTTWTLISLDEITNSLDPSEVETIRNSQVEKLLKLSINLAYSCKLVHVMLT